MKRCDIELLMNRNKIVFPNGDMVDERLISYPKKHKYPNKGGQKCCMICGYNYHHICRPCKKKIMADLMIDRDGRCEHCGRISNLTLHHVSKINHPMDMAWAQLLCRACHDGVHGIFPNKKKVKK